MKYAVFLYCLFFFIFMVGFFGSSAGGEEEVLPSRILKLEEEVSSPRTLKPEELAIRLVELTILRLPGKKEGFNNETDRAVSLKRLKFKHGTFKGGVTVFEETFEAAYWVKDAKVYAVNGIAMTWSPEIEVAGGHVNFFDVKDSVGQ